MELLGILEWLDARFFAGANFAGARVAKGTIKVGLYPDGFWPHFWEEIDAGHF